MSNYAFANNKVPRSQMKAVPGKVMVDNLAGAKSFVADNFTALERWLLTGSTSNMFYQNKEDATEQNVDILNTCIKENPKKVAERIKNASDHGISNSTPILALAVLSSSEDINAKKEFSSLFPYVVRTASQLYEFLEYVKGVRGFGKVIHKAVDNWVLNNKSLEYQFLKYQSRNGWAHRDVLRKFHITPKNENMNALFKWAVKGYEETLKDKLEIIPYFEAIKKAENEKEVISLIRDGKLTHEMVVGNYQKMTTGIWQELFLHMPMTATIRFLATLTANDVFKNKDNLDVLEKRLLDSEALTRARIHPIAFAKALSIYQTGGEGSEKSKLRFAPIGRVIDILNAGIERAGECINPTGKDIFISVDVSGSMWSNPIFGNLVPAQVAGLIALSIVKAEKNYTVGMFDTQFRLMNVNKGTSFGSILDRRSGLWPRDFGGTDASLAYKYAREKKMIVDSFICITDSESWAGNHPFQEFNRYKKEVNNNAKALYITLLPYGDRTTLVDPSDPNSFDIAGFSDNTVKLIQMIVQDF